MKFLRRFLDWEPAFRAGLDRQLLADGSADFHLNPVERRYLHLRHYAFKWAVSSGIWLPNPFRILIGLTLRPGDIFIDVGANVGWMTEMGAVLVGANGSVISFEPSPSTMNLLRRRVERLALRNVTLVQAAVGEQSGQLTLYEYDENYGGASGLRPGGWIGHQHVAETLVDLATLDDFVTSRRIESIRLIKIDVQGAEIDVLRGASRLLASERPPVLFVEIERDACIAFGRTPADLIVELTRAGYRLFSWRAQGLEDVLSEDKLPADGHDDAICLRLPQHQPIFQRLQYLAERRNNWLARQMFQDDGAASRA